MSQNDYEYFENRGYLSFYSAYNSVKVAKKRGINIAFLT